MIELKKFLHNVLISIRLKHWIKNGFVFIPLIFVGWLFNEVMLLKVLNLFFIFCLTSSSVYLLNDVLDKEKDKKHPLKKQKPIAKGEISTKVAILLSLILLVISTVWAFKINKGVIIFIWFYYFLNIFYSLFLKNYLLLDVFAISLNYLVRVYAGAYIINIGVSEWLFLIIFLFSLVMSFGKRKEEILLLNEEAKNHRRSLEFYSEDLLNQMIIITSTLTIISYILYTVAPETILKHGRYLVYSSPLVIFGFLRYLYLVNKKQMGSPVEVFLKDKELFSTVFIWGLLILALIYFF